MSSGASPEWRKEFANRREKYIASLRAAVVGCDVVARLYYEEEGYTDFSVFENGKLVRFEKGTLVDAESFLRHLIDQGHMVAYAVSREGAKASVCVSYDMDQEEWSPAWPEGFRVDAEKTSEPMREVW
jgi:hypothetical protein